MDAQELQFRQVGFHALQAAADAVFAGGRDYAA